MSVSSVSSNLSLAQPDWRSAVNQWKQDFKQLASSLQSGDLPGAQHAYAALLQLQQSAQSGGQSSSGQAANSPIQNDFAALGKALSSGDLSGAQSAFSQLQTDMKASLQTGNSGGVQSAHHGHRHRHASSASDSDSGSADATTGGSTGTTINIYA